MNFLPLFYLGRVFNLCFYVLCAYRAIQLMPRYKLLILLIALLPMSLHQAASYSYDSYINGLSLLLTARILKAAWNPESAYYDESNSMNATRQGRLKKIQAVVWAGIGAEGTISWKELGAILLIALIWAPAKPVYTPLLLLLFLIPAERFGSRKKKILYCSAIIVIVLVEALVMQGSMIRSMVQPEAVVSLNYEGEPNYTVGWVLNHPMDTLVLIWRSIRLQYKDWLYSAMGNNFAGLSIHLSERYMQIYIILLLLSVLRRTEAATFDREAASLASERFSVTPGMRVLYMGAIVISVGLIMGTMLLSWTSEGSAVINGIQGRYFLPILFLIPMCMDNRILVLHRNPDRLILLTGLCMHMMTIAGILTATIAT